MSTKAKYVKSNVTPESNAVLRMLAAEQRKYIYEVIDDILRRDYPEYFRKIECWKEQSR
jgi:hypothetical protein